MKCKYKIIKITNEESLKNTLFIFSGDTHFVYRGQGDCIWTLQTSLERKINALNISSFDINGYESRIIQEYSDFFNDRANLLPINIIANIQDYGGATRLIDFTREFAIALFFAFCDFPSRCASVWALSRNNLPYVSKAEIDKHNGELRLFELDFQRNLEEEKVFQFFIEEFIYSEHSSLDEFIKEKMEDYPEEMKEYKIGALDFLASKESEINSQYQAEHGIQSEILGEVSPRERFVQDSLKQYCNEINNKRLFNQKGLFLFSSNFLHNFEENIFFGKKINEIEEDLTPIVDPDFTRLEGLRSNIYNAQRGVIKFNIDSSLTKFILNTLRNGKYDIELHDFWDPNSGRSNIETENIRYDGTSTTFKALFPSDIGFFKDLIHRMIE